MHGCGLVCGEVKAQLELDHIIEHDVENVLRAQAGPLQPQNMTRRNARSNAVKMVRVAK